MQKNDQYESDINSTAQDMLELGANDSMIEVVPELAAPTMVWPKFFNSFHLALPIISMIFFGNFSRCFCLSVLQGPTSLGCYVHNQ